MSETPMTNIDPERVAEALAILTLDEQKISLAMNGVKKARTARKNHQIYYEEQFGIDAKAIEERAREKRMTARERERKYVTEQITRRALSLWEAESPEDFEELMAAASEVPAATGDGAEKLAGVSAYIDGFNSGAHGGAAITDNKFTPGTMEHQQWALGCADGIGENPREAPPMQAANGEAAAPAPQKRGRGRPPGSPNRKQASTNGAAQTSPEADHPSPEEDAGDPAATLFSDTMGDVPA